MKARRRLTMDSPELNLVPLLDMVSLLIQLLLINAQFGVFAEVGAALGAPSSAPGEGLQLQIHVNGAGFTASWQDKDGRMQRQLPCAGPCGPVESYDLAGLAALAAELDQQHPDDQVVQLRLDAEVPFELTARVMDAMRGPGDRAFPDVVLGGP